MCKTICPVTNSPAYNHTALQQAESFLADTIDTHNWGRLSQSFTPDVLYNNSQFNIGKGGICRGLTDCTAALQAATGTGLTRHDVTVAKIDFISATAARVLTYLIWSQWQPEALTDYDQTFRVWYRCHDLWVVQEGVWKLKESLVDDMGPRFEMPYFGEGL
ncbi:hypothetical protein K402DRAFT_375666 [Aulographum hederae CBS 113979]|uniref:SnoaL-like domain-containing protein n=1 Tax=Aulographum hederae CBS 113979 TaxID=1176131 RepID=A0A6G1H3A2_9PEZI|nr:hypothetical protein K402DRAFT_375666 [Aulographum hederae CBS 113979]